MGELVVGLDSVPLPRLVRVRQEFPAPTIADPAAAVGAELARPEITALLHPGAKVAVAIGSRGIAGIAGMARATIEALRRHGVEPFIVPAMGSHGKATPEGQREVLARLGVTAESAGAPIVSTMETDVVGHLRWDEAAAGYRPCSPGPDAIPIVCARDALRADLVIPICRVKPHTGFRGSYESGIAKMLTIGLGKHDGCSRFHREGYPRFATLIPAAARLVLATGKIAFALAVVENAADAPALIEAVPAARTMEREPQLLARAKELMPRLLPPEIDVLVVERFGKDISGVGMDPNVTGRAELGIPEGFAGPRIRRIVVLGLSEGAGGNATGIGMADVITEELSAAIDRAATVTNVLTSGSLAGGRIPVAVPGADLAIRAAISCVPGVRPVDVRLVRIRDTLHLAEIAVSENLLSIVRSHAQMQELEGTW